MTEYAPRRRLATGLAGLAMSHCLRYQTASRSAPLSRTAEGPGLLLYQLVRLS